MRTFAVVALLLAAVLGAAWWTALLMEPSMGEIFLPDGVEPRLIRTFLLADAAFFVIAPAAAAKGVLREASWAWAAQCLHVGGVLYAALWGWGLVVETGQGWFGAALMTPPALVFAFLAWRLRPGA